MGIIEKILVYSKKLLTLIGAIICTLIWLGLFPILIYRAMANGMVLDAPESTWVGNIVFFVSFLLPLSSFATIICIWTFYFQNKIPHMYCSNMIPILTTLILGIIIPLLIDLAKIFALIT